MVLTEFGMTIAYGTISYVVLASNALSGLG